VPPFRGGVLMTEQCGADEPVGGILRQPTVRGEDGTVSRIDELFGPSFAVIGRKEKDLEMGAEASAVLECLGGRTVSLEGLGVVEGAMDNVFEVHSALVLRPDRYIFGVVDEDWDLDSLLGELGRRITLA
jgi:hypothetical protein